MAVVASIFTAKQSQLFLMRPHNTGVKKEMAVIARRLSRASGMADRDCMRSLCERIFRRRRSEAISYIFDKVTI
jgi:hypothetical protein